MKDANIKIDEIASIGVPDTPIWDSKHVHVDFSLSQNNKSSTPSDVFKGLFNELKEKYKGYCQIYTDGSKVEAKVASAVYVTGCSDLSYRLRNGCSIFTAETEAIYKALCFVSYSSRTHFVIFSDSLSVLQAIHGQESQNPLVNKVIQACQDIFQKKKYIVMLDPQPQTYSWKRKS